jgi:hypothetical protein
LGWAVANGGIASASSESESEIEHDSKGEGVSGMYATKNENNAHELGRVVELESGRLMRFWIVVGREASKTGRKDLSDDITMMSHDSNGTDPLRSVEIGYQA